MAGNFEAVRREVTAEILRILTNNCVMPRVTKRDFNQYWSEGGRRIGASLDIRRPLRVIGADGQSLQPEGLVRVTVPMTISYWNQEAFVYNDTEEAMFLDQDKRKSYLMPHAVNLANKVDRYMMQYMQSIIPNYVGTPGTTPSALSTYNSAQTLLNQMLALNINRSVIYNSVFNQNIISASQTLFNPQQIIGKQYLEGKVGRYAEFDFMLDEQVPSFTACTFAGSPVINGSNQTGSTLAINGLTPGSFSCNPGDRFYVTAVNRINSQSRLALPNVPLQQVITSSAVDAAGAVSLNIFPGFVPSGPYQNCTGSPAAGAAINFANSTGALCTTSFALQEEAFTWAAIPLQDVEEYGAKCNVMDSPDGNYSLRTVWQWDNRLGEVTCRTDFVWGIAQTYAEYSSLVIYG